MRSTFLRISILIFSLLIFVGACTPADEKVIQDLLNSTQKTAEAALKQKGPEALTEIARLRCQTPDAGRPAPETWEQCERVRQWREGA